jgi:8-oxo-dGTP pyrophosphatase MutT (NUDIX family)/phosphohistidine phosphatase SixA
MSDLIRAAGAVVWRPGPRGPEILLIHRSRYDDWSLPKGKRERHEHLLLTAVREVDEETSVRPVLGPRLLTVSYRVRGEPKRVDYWSAVAEGDAKPSNEVDAIEWLPLAEAKNRLSYPHDVDVVSGLVPEPTVPLIVVRHASAGPKRGDDLRRPLDAKGRRQAAALPVLLAAFAPHARVLSSPARRCVDTVRQYAASAGAEIEEIPDLRTTNVASSEPLIRSLVAAGQPAVVCVHRENLPVVIAAGYQALGAPPPADPALPKGGFWVVHAAAGRLAGAARHTLSH